MFTGNIKESDHASPKLVCFGGLISILGVAIMSFSETLTILLVSVSLFLILLGSSFMVYAHNHKIEGEVTL